VLRARATIEVQGKLVSAYVLQGNLEDARTSYEAVRTDFARLLESGIDEPFTRYYVACAAAMMGEQQEALQNLEQAIQMRRHFNVARARLESDFIGLRDNARFRTLIEATQ